ncbi:HK97-gp10 family putative phage morphogenesis protein [Bacillus smithii]|uniref:HK97-gp10 family putative phage morphogenesis protein n=1 Tax=Bacillus smithii TaxID=1479 RepID=UPI003D207B53
MGLDIDTSSIDKALKQLAGKEKRVRNKALKKAGEAIAEKLRENTPVDQTDHNQKHMKDDIVVSGVDQYGEIKIGYGQETAWRVHFVEMGTIKQRPQHFIERTEQEMQEEVMKIVEEELRKGLGL